MAKRRRRSPGEPEVEAAEPDQVQPLDVDGVRTVAVVTVLWAVAFVLLALRMDTLQAEGRGWWVWTCLAGVGLGLLGLEYARKRRDAIEFEREEAEAALAEASSADSEVLTRGEVMARDADAGGPVAGGPARPQSSPDSVTRPIDTGDNLPPVRPDTTRPDTTRVDTTRVDLPPARPGARPDPRSARPDATAHGRPSWTGERPIPPSRPAPSAAERPAAPSRPATGERPVPPSARPAAPERPAAAPRSGSGTSPAAPQRAAAAPSRPAPADRRPAPPPPERPSRRTPPPSASELFGDVPTRPAPSPADDDEPLLDTTFGGRRTVDETPADDTDDTEGGSGYRGRRARRSDTA